MDVKKAAQRVGGQAELARRMGVTRGLVWHWAHGAAIPPLRQLQIQKLTGVKADLKVLSMVRTLTE